MREVLNFLYGIIQSAWSMLNSSSAWVVFSFIVAGLLHEFIKPENLQKTAIGSTKVRPECYFQSVVAERFHLESVCTTAAHISVQH